MLRVQKQLLPSMTVGALRKLVATVLKLPPGTDVQLSYRESAATAATAATAAAGAAAGEAVPLDDPSKPLSAYNVQSGGEIVASE